MSFEKYIIVTNDEKECYKVSGSFVPLAEINKVFRNGWDTEEDAQFALSVIIKEWRQQLCDEYIIGINKKIKRARDILKKLQEAKIIKVKSTYEFVR